MNGPVMDSEEVATLAKVLTPLKYGMLPIVAAVDVERPPNEMVGVVPPLEMIGNVPETLVTCAALVTEPRPTSVAVRANIDLYVEVERPVETPAPAVLRPMISP